MERKPMRGFPLIELLVVIAIIAILAAILFPVFAKARERAKTTACISNLKQIGLAVMTYTDDYDGTYPKNRNYPGIPGYTWKRAIYPYVKSFEAFKCPSVTTPYNDINTNTVPGDESNTMPQYRTDKSQWMPASYAYCGGFFHEASSGSERPRRTSEVKEPAGTLFIINSRLALPDLGPWTMDWGTNTSAPKHTGEISYGNGANYKFGAYASHNGRIPFVMADGHVAALKLWDTVYPNDMWKSNVSGYTTAAQLQVIAQRCSKEYR